MNWLPLLRGAGFEKIARVYLQDARYGLSALGSRWARCGNSNSFIRIFRDARCLHLPTTIARHTRAVGMSDGGQGFAGGVGRDRPRGYYKVLLRIAVEHAGAGACLLMPVLGRRATDRGEATTASAG